VKNRKFTQLDIAGYVPDQYPTDTEWEARRMMELSLAIKCPSINYHLAGTKKVSPRAEAERALFGNVPGLLL
jgi:hypothetical protein